MSLVLNARPVQGVAPGTFLPIVKLLSGAVDTTVIGGTDCVEVNGKKDRKKTRHR